MSIKILPLFASIVRFLAFEIVSLLVSAFLIQAAAVIGRFIFFLWAYPADLANLDFSTIPVSLIEIFLILSLIAFPISVIVFVHIYIFGKYYLRKKLGTLIFALTVIAGYSGSVYFWPTLYRVDIENRTSRDVEITTARVDHKSFITGGRILKPISPGEYYDPEKHIIYHYGTYGVRNSVLVIHTKHQNDEPVVMSCNLIAQNRNGCYYRASIHDTGLICYCEDFGSPYALFLVDGSD